MPSAEFTLPQAKNQRGSLQACHRQSIRYTQQRAALAQFILGDNMKVSFRVAAAVLAVASLSACATITRGSKQKFEITSEPSAAQVVTTLGDKCVTPCKLKLKRKEAFTATFTKDGFETQQVNVRSKFSGGGAAAGAGNILIGGFIGAGVDASSGALNNLEPNPLKVVLKPVAPKVEEPVVAAASPATAADAAASAPAPAAEASAAAPASTVAPAAASTAPAAAPATAQ